MRFIFMCFFLGVYVSHFSGAVVFRFTNLVCVSYNESWYIVQHCRLKAVSRSKVILNFNGTVLHSVNDIQVHVKAFKKASGFKPWLLDSKVDVCRFLKRNYDPFVKLVFSLFKDFSNFNHSCPYLGLQMVKGFYLRPELLHLPIPTGEYMLMIRWYFDKKLQFDTNVSFLFVEDLKAT
ncbi:uncharacterized protein [Drosophila kikkawai]|uniref:Uncharacterized protein n=1 Tax=Drosophila kikkawai TaxID=30033 RepID=A0A6P4HLN6_DROKI|nr:uncharacterized protein LOC108070503 [Drosophila kikkawai]